MIQVSQHHRNRGIEDGAASLREWFRRHGFAIVNDGWLEFHFA